VRFPFAFPFVLPDDTIRLSPSAFADINRPAEKVFNIYIYYRDAIH